MPLIIYMRTIWGGNFFISKPMTTMFKPPLLSYEGNSSIKDMGNDWPHRMFVYNHSSIPKDLQKPPTNVATHVHLITHVFHILKPGSDRDVHSQWTKPSVQCFVRLIAEGTCHVSNQIVFPVDGFTPEPHVQCKGILWSTSATSCVVKI